MYQHRFYRILSRKLTESDSIYVSIDFTEYCQEYGPNQRVCSSIDFTEYCQEYGPNQRICTSIDFTEYFYDLDF